ncbi:ATP/GTP-binding protein [Thiopseudomonas alkaliphila]|uniref:ATP/GTP-binding protein n=1 Tax=Thiopseudomonas alkaliphila TaxID=1697053 RepID=A0AAW7DR38_9GAMM|nr:ATP/GTP-binding protein [Thiopseudomonas alkaliphila]MDM1696306.1 ATP/GTP-binding protein [Thiopseudomonas alkaliphila]
MAQQYKLIFTGPVGAGKTTAIAALSDSEVISTDSKATDMTRERKETTTVAMDYGTLRLEDGTHIHLYGTPGQERFDFMWEILTEGGFGLMLLIDNTRQQPLQDLEFYVKSFREFIDATQLVVGVTRMDQSRVLELDDYNNKLLELNVRAPVFEVDARSKQDVSVMLEALLHSLNVSTRNA